MTKPPIVDRGFAEKFFWAVDRPFEYSVYQLIHEWWAEAPQAAIDDYAGQLAALDGSAEFLAERYLPEPLSLDDLERCAPGTLGHGYRSFILDNALEANLSVNYQSYHASLEADGALDRLPADMNYMSVRLSQIHDFIHVLSGYDPTPAGELAVAAFHAAQLRYPYHPMRIAVTTAHVAFVSPRYLESSMDAFTTGWQMGRLAGNLHFTRWEEHLDTPLAELRRRFRVDTSIADTFRAG